ncbi:DNA protecting protein DprA [Ethanoligenens harbinense YUAN-3]|uniref:DNA protecting protein DprA n=1 Tax=Ethanoligenens harbinense (strain DSM 18485 / JCM 12961 / CGMCC 1.5033 / YUAN-3) TaxID=663278 RepID=E6U7W6_ETHHY|nr:DNA protecting protein DprA [Ethanoligenens harbinense YUAN-3]
MTDVEHWIWLAQAFSPGSPKPCALAEALGGARVVHEADEAALAASGICTAHDLSLLRPHSLAQAERIIEHCLARGYDIRTFADEDYPALLREIHAPPAVLYVSGRLPAADMLCIAMVGARRVTDYGAAAAERLAMGLANAGVGVVSGLAAGVDTHAHKGALKGGGKTYAVLGCGLDTVYPASNRELYRLVAKTGAVLSEFPPDAGPDRHHFPIRNRIIAGLCAGTVVVEAGRKSGSLITAGQALEMGRDVFAVPGSIFSPMSEGTNQLLREGAKPACGVADLLEEYPEALARILPAEPAQQSLFPPAAVPPRPEPVPEKPATPARRPVQGLDDVQRAVLALLDASPRHVDELAVRASLPPGQVLAVLTVLEIQGLARSEPGRRFCTV